jgi:hypothetical protein
MTQHPPAFSNHGPFDEEERAVIREVFGAVGHAKLPNADVLLQAVGQSIEQLERLQAKMASLGKHVIGTEDLAVDKRTLSVPPPPMS